MVASDQEILMDIVEVQERNVVSELMDATVREHAHMVFRIAYSVLRHHADAEDAAQEVFLKVLRNQKELANVRNQKAWIAKIAWRTALDWAKSQPKNEESPATIESLREPGKNIDDVMAEQERMELLRSLIATLPRDLREPLILSTAQEMSSADIAEVLSIPEASVRTRMARARTMLKQKLEVLLRSHSR